MTPEPTGRVIRTEAGRDLVLTRRFEANIEDVWASVTEPERTARWFGSWTGKGEAGQTIQLKMGFEEETTPVPAVIEVCEPPRHLSLSTIGDHGFWLLDLELSEAEGTTELRFTHHLGEGTDVGSVGPGWEYYLDNLVAAEAEQPMPDFGDYYPAQKDHYLREELRSN